MIVRTSARTSRAPKRLVALAAVAALTLAACGDDDDDDAGTAAATEDASAATTAAAVATTAAPAATEASGRDDIYGAEGSDTAGTTAAPAAAEGGALGIATTDLGDIVVDSAGMALYMFMPDNASTPTCTADCAQAWPPLLGEATAGDGVDSSLIGSAEHPESGAMVTYNGWPLYYFAGDSAPGDTNGQGQGGVWYVIDATGTPIDSE